MYISGPRKGQDALPLSSQSASSSVYSGSYDNSYGSYDEEGFDLFEFILGVIFVYIIICVLFNALMPSRGGCLSYFFMGWLFGRGSRRPPRGPRPPDGRRFRRRLWPASAPSSDGRRPSPASFPSEPSFRRIRRRQFSRRRLWRRFRRRRQLRRRFFPRRRRRTELLSGLSRACP